MAGSITGSRESLAEVMPSVVEALEVATALIYLQEHPESTIENALRVGEATILRNKLLEKLKNL